MLITTESLYNEHWHYVLKLLPAYGVKPAWQDDARAGSRARFGPICIR